jgi:sec-independent protein translocase protein TatA
MQEILVILVLALIFLGPKKLPELASGIGKAIREVRKATAGIKNEIQLDDAIRKPLEELREATMLPPEELVRRDEERKWREQREREDAELAARAAAEDQGMGSANSTTDESLLTSDGTLSASDVSEVVDETVPTDVTVGSTAPSDLTTRDLPPVAVGVTGVSGPVPSPMPPVPSSRHSGPVPAPVLPASSRQTSSAVPAPVLPAASGPAPALPASASSSSGSSSGSSSRPVRAAAGRPDDRTIAMPLPPPMEGSGTAALPPPRPSGRVAPPPPPVDAMKHPAGAVPRPSSTLFGVPSTPTVVSPPVVTAPAAPAPVAPTPSGKAQASGSAPARNTAPFGVKLPDPPAKKSSES